MDLSNDERIVRMTYSRIRRCMECKIDYWNIPEAHRIAVDYEQDVQESQPAPPDLPYFFGKGYEMIVVQESCFEE